MCPAPALWSLLFLALRPSREGPIPSAYRECIFTLTAMDSLVHPTQLSVWQRFLQARRLHKETSRSKNPDWYGSALELDYQLHLFLEGDSVSEARLCIRQASGRKWVSLDCPGPDLEDGALEDFISTLRKEHLGGQARSLGVVLQLADEFAISELAHANERPEDLGALSKQLVCAPQEVLQDHSTSTDESSFRLFPYPGAKPGQLFGAAITISRKHQEFLRKFRRIGESLNFPILTTALSAPLVALAALPKLSSQLPSQPFCIFFSYSTFAVIAFFTSEGDLVMLRSVRHHAGGTPPHVGRIIQTMAAALELPEPLVYVLPLSQSVVAKGTVTLPDLPNASLLNWQQNADFNAEVPLEFQGASALASLGEQAEGLAASQTFRDMAERQWATQDFLPPSAEESEMYPSQMEMKALRFGGIGLRVGAVTLALFIGWTGLRAFQILRDEAWHLKESGGSTEGNRILAAQISRYEAWNSMLRDRSKAWVSMELMNQLFPNPNSVVLSEANHTVRPELTREQSNASVVKEWTINGLVNAEALDHLTAINTTEGMSKVFHSVYKLTGDESLRTDLPTRSLVVNLLASENKQYKPETDGGGVETQFPFIFNLTVSQRISSEDPLAIPTTAAP